MSYSLFLYSIISFYRGIYLERTCTIAQQLNKLKTKRRLFQIQAEVSSNYL